MHKTYVVKVGNLYVMTHGGLSDRQRDALWIASTLAREQPRLVRIRTREERDADAAIANDPIVDAADGRRGDDVEP